MLEHVQPGERVWFDDGKIGGVVEQVEPDTLHVRITQARLKGEKLRNDKGINLPDTRLPLPSLTAQDLEDLAFVVQHADMVGLSFASSPADVEQLQHHLAQLTDRPVSIILKIETQRGFEQLPVLLLSAMQARSCGVMIARGDLAVECGFERLAEVQEEILWLCEAAHVPAIWATQVLESLASGGLPSRAEISDAAMSDRAECVMLNKGPRVVQAVQTLDGIFRRMQQHQHKKSAMLRSLHVAQLLPEPDPARL
ncbi:pyruvate kinase [Hymenobacter humi]|uniref:Pyruvate kinase n=1 Tax=Hymenobacter humi TaxID=1411620 RepID=A0ABW2UBX8_9BACT